MSELLGPDVASVVMSKYESEDLYFRVLQNRILALTGEVITNPSEYATYSVGNNRVTGGLILFAGGRGCSKMRPQGAHLFGTAADAFRCEFRLVDDKPLTFGARGDFMGGAYVH
jgi:hypothetical protein